MRKETPLHRGGEHDVVLEAEGLAKVFSNGRGVKDVSFKVHRGEITVIMGPNGAGKTTSFRMACGLITPQKGKVLLNGRDVTRWPMYRRAKEGKMGYLAQDRSIFRDLTVEDNLLSVMELLHFNSRRRRERCEELLQQFQIDKLRKTKAMLISGGEKRRLEVARALVSDPNIILLDEPFPGVDPKTVDGIQQVVRTLRDQGISVLITDHQVRETLQIADYCYIVLEGEILCEGTPDEVVRNPLAQEHYFGKDDSLVNSNGG
jgi:lipopolysaccharide export system ATP-binding protein